MILINFLFIITPLIKYLQVNGSIPLGQSQYPFFGKSMHFADMHTLATYL